MFTLWPSLSTVYVLPKPTRPANALRCSCQPDKWQRSYSNVCGFVRSCLSSLALLVLLLSHCLCGSGTRLPAILRRRGNLAQGSVCTANLPPPTTACLPDQLPPSLLIVQNLPAPPLYLPLLPRFLSPSLCLILILLGSLFSSVISVYCPVEPIEW